MPEAVQVVKASLAVIDREHNVRIGGDFNEAFSAWVTAQFHASIARAKANGRKTVLAPDV